MAHRQQTHGAEPAETTARRLLVMRAGAHAFGVFADEVESVNGGLRPTPLPFAPPAVLGVVSVRGWMRTLLDPPALLGDRQSQSEQPAEEAPPVVVVALHGDEQLALAVERVERIILARAVDLLPPDQPDSPVRGILQEEDARIIVLDPAKIFAAATRGTERRRQRLLS